MLRSRPTQSQLDQLNRIGRVKTIFKEINGLTMEALQRGKPTYFYLSGTSMAAPHVTGTVALMLEENPSLTQSQAEALLESSAIPLGAGCRSVLPTPGAEPEEICWASDATGAGLLDAEAAVAATP